MNNSINLLENFLEQQKQKYVIAGAYGALGLALLVILATRGGKSSLSASSSRNEKEEKSSKKSGSQSNGTACVGSYHVSGYTRADGTEVSDYTRTCGAKHFGKNKEKNKVQTEEPDYFAENEGYDVLQGRVEKTREVEKETQEKNNVDDKSYYSYLDEFATLQKKVTQVKFCNNVLPLKDYYKISLDLADKPDDVKSNERYQVYKVSDLPSDFDKNVVYQKIARGMNIDLSSEGRKNLFKDVRVVIPRDNSKLVELIKNSDEIQEILKREKDNILEGKYKNKYLPGGVEFKMPQSKDILKGQFNNKATLFGVIHNADIYDISSTQDRNVHFVITDFYDYDNWKFDEQDSIRSRYVKILNNSAYIQQKADQLMPYVLYIPIKIMRDEYKNIIKKGTKNF